MKLNQKQRVIRHLETHGSITPLDALKEYSIMRLAAVVFDLKEDGYRIDTEMTTGYNTFGEKVTFEKYTVNEQEKVS